MRIVTWNVNGLRAALRKGFEDAVRTLEPDVLLLQEIRCTPADLVRLAGKDGVRGDWSAPEGWHVRWHPAQRPGYSGVAVLAREPFRTAGIGLGGDDADEEGRVLTVRVRDLRIASVYLPSGSSSDERQRVKERFMRAYGDWAAGQVRSRIPTIHAGDYNVARDERDIFHWRSNQDVSGFLPHERAWLNDLVASGWHDLVREEAGDREGPYTWWSNRGQARALDRGWRIDHVLANRRARGMIVRAQVHRDLCLSDEGPATSDHAPVSVDVDA